MTEPSSRPEDHPGARSDLAEALAVSDPARASHAAQALLDDGRSGEALDLLAAYAANGSTGAVDRSTGAADRSTGVVGNGAANGSTGAAAHRPALDLLVEVLDGSGTVHRFVGSMLLDRTAVDDVAQDVLISVVRSIHDFQGGTFTTWVHTIAQRRVVDHLRRQRESLPLHEADSPSVRMSSMIATRASVQQALARLPELYRDPVTLRDMEGLTYAEISERLQRSLGTVKSQVSRGRAMVAAMFTDGPGRDQDPGSGRTTG